MNTDGYIVHTVHAFVLVLVLELTVKAVVTYPEWTGLDTVLCPLWSMVSGVQL